MRQDLRTKLLSCLLVGSLLWSAKCSSATPPVSVVPNCMKPRPSEVTAGKDCKEIEAPVLLDCVDPEYPADVRKEKLEGKVVARAVLTADANLEGMKIVSSPSEALSGLAVDAFRQWRYKPAFCRDSGKPVQAYITMTTTFSLHGKARNPGQP